MLKITLDMYSGRPNPEYILSEDKAVQLLKEVALNKGAITEINTIPSRLGFRGVKVNFLSDYIPQFYDLPSSFSFANGASMHESKGREIAERLVSGLTGDPSTFGYESNFELFPREWVLKQLKVLPALAFPQFKSNDIRLKTETLPCPYEKVQFEPDFWNAPEHLRKNNCYNFATNRRTDTFAQPGRASGKLYSNISCEEVTNGAIADGSHKIDNCSPETEIPRFLMALVVAPGPEFVDYHWYRQCSDGNWAHKPGQTPARSTDNSNHQITDPSIADRGPYSEFCGYLLAPKSMNVN
ncbi:hypothetical protein NST38_31435 [Paenibacillus sp. FSL H8-0104]|uniref:hypothetical protein n=1 Tax=Paenibacillus sp. FSL H8-0104 TaxID=2954509 RepID=UPI0030FD85BF